MLFQVFILSIILGFIIGFIVADFMAYERGKELTRDLRLAYQVEDELREYIWLNNIKDNHSSHQ